jgi:predicted O-methyltransferase YrrM
MRNLEESHQQGSVQRVRIKTTLGVLFAAAISAVSCSPTSTAATEPPPPPAPRATSPAAPLAFTPAPMSADVERLLAEIKSRDREQLAVSEEDGRFLRMLIATRGARRALEIGGASGYSAIWMGTALRATGGRLVTIEYDPVRAKELAENVRRAGLDDVVQVIAGDAFAEIPKIDGTFDFVFLDAWKKDYKRFFEMVHPRLDLRGLFVAHNVVNKRQEMEDFLQLIDTHPSLWTTIVSPSGEGVSVSMKVN